MPTWMLDETAGAGRKNLDEAHVARYDAKEDAGHWRRWRCCRAWASTNGRRCSTWGRMLRSLRSRVLSGLTNVEVAQAGFLTYEPSEPGAVVDIAYSRYAASHTDDGIFASYVLRAA